MVAFTETPDGTLKHKDCKRVGPDRMVEADVISPTMTTVHKT